MGGRRALGRSLDELLQEGLGGRRTLPLEQIEPNPWQPREPIAEEGLEALAASIRRHGVLQPLVVTRDEKRPGIYVLVAGERRWRAARLAGVQEVPVSVVEAGERERLEMALVENLQRADLAALERAAGYRGLMGQFGLSQAEVGQAVGMSRSGVANTLRLLELDEEARRELAAGRITEGHARALLSVTAGPARKRLLQEVLGENLSVRAAEGRARASGRRGEATAARRPELSEGLELQRVAEQLQRRLGTRVVVRGTASRGRLVIEFYSAEELEALLAQLLGGEGFT